jgi:hypothetical protein
MSPAAIYGIDPNHIACSSDRACSGGTAGVARASGADYCALKKQRLGDLDVRVRRKA